jgi:hypothetical protein
LFTERKRRRAALGKYRLIQVMNLSRPKIPDQPSDTMRPGLALSRRQAKDAVTAPIAQDSTEESSKENDEVSSTIPSSSKRTPPSPP